MMDVADIVEMVISEIGFGRWQYLFLLTACLSQIVGPVQQLSSPLLSAPVPFRCSLPEQHPLIDKPEPEYPSECLDLSLPIFNNSRVFNVSVISLQKRLTSLASCPYIEYDQSIFQSTVITEWNLVCEDYKFRPLFQMTYAIGAILGTTFCGQLSDWLGRKRSLQIGSIMTLVSTLLAGWVPWYTVMIATRILSGTGTILMLFPAYTIVSEVSPSKSRAITAAVIGLSYFVAISALAGIAYLIPHWRKLILICNFPMLLVVPLTFMIDESPRWLMQHGRAAEGIEILKKAAKQNSSTLSLSTSSVLDKFSQGIEKDKMNEQKGNEECEKSEGSLYMLKMCFSSAALRRIVMGHASIWFLVRMLYVGIVINANNFTGSSPFQYVAISGAMGVTAMVFTIPLSVKLSRRVFIGLTLLTSGMLMLLEPLVPQGFLWIKWIMVMFSFCTVCGAFQINYTYGNELFPTVLRARGIAFTNLIGTVGEMIAPLITDIAVQHHWWIASVTFGLAGILCVLLLPFLPETTGKPMPETIQDIEDRYKNSSNGAMHGPASHDLPLDCSGKAGIDNNCFVADNMPC